MDLNSINANINRLLTNIWAVISFLKEFAVDGAKNVSITYINADGSESVKTFSNIAKMTADIRATISGEMYKTVYVDEVNGDNNNSGSSSSPLKDIHLAVSKVPHGGKIQIFLLSDCNFSANVYSYNRVIQFSLNGFSLNTVKYADAEEKMLLFSINGFSNTVFFYGNSKDGSRVVLPALADGEAIFSPDHSVFIKSSGSNEPENCCVHFGYGADIEDNGDFYISSVTNSVGSFSLSGGELIQSNGSTRELTDLVSGIKRNADGLPLNLQSNLEF